MKLAIILFAGVIACGNSGSIRDKRQVSSINIDLEAALAAAGSGWSAENHADNVAVAGAGGWSGPNAELAIVSSGESIGPQDGAIFQLTTQDGDTAASLNNVGVYQSNEASEGQVLDALGMDISNAQSGWSGAAAEGAAAVDATSSVVISGAPNLGVAKP